MAVLAEQSLSLNRGKLPGSLERGIYIEWLEIIRPELPAPARSLKEYGAPVRNNCGSPTAETIRNSRGCNETRMSVVILYIWTEITVRQFSILISRIEY